MVNRLKQVVRIQKQILWGSLCVLALFALLVCTSGCDSVLDPAQIGRFRPVPVVNVILDSLGVGEEPESIYANAEDPRPEDVLDYEQDHIFSPGDIIRISIYELRSERQPFINDYTVTETGRVSIPDVGQVTAEGLTEAQLEQVIVDILHPRILINPSVSAVLMNSRRNSYMISGAGLARQGGQVPIPRYGYRLRDAIESMGGVSQFNVSNIYVTRRVKGEDLSFGEIGDYEKNWNGYENGRDTEQGVDQIRDIIEPYVSRDSRQRGIVITSSEMVTDEELESMALLGAQGSENSGIYNWGIIQASSEGSDESESGGAGRIEWVFENGKWIPIQVGGEVVEEPIKKREVVRKIEKRDAADYGWEDIGSGGVHSRMIRIPVDKLLSGDERYNIVVRAGDSITVPVDIVGEFYLMGNVNRVGVATLQGRPMTLKQALAAAGGLGQLAWPKKVEITRRIGKDKEVTVMVDLDKIAKGLQPDFFIKQHDLINVGTHVSSIWRATLRNAFRATYGFGFLYDRNFASEDFGNDPFPGHISINKIF